MRRSAAVILLAMAPAISASQTPGEFGAARFIVPAGFTLDNRPTVQMYSRVKGQELCLIAIYADETSPPSLNAAFTTAWQSIFQPNMYRRRDLPTPSIQQSPAGNRYAMGEGDLEDLRGNRFLGRLHVFPVGTKTQSIVLLSNGRPAQAGCRKEWDTFFASIRFPSAPAVTEAPGQRSDTNVGRTPPMPDRPAPVPVPADIPATPGAPQKFENLEFTPPPGWSVSRAGGAMVLRPPRGYPDEYLEVVLMGGHPASSAMPNEFAASWRELAGRLGMQMMNSVNGGNYDLNEPLRTYAGWEYVLGNGAMRPANGPQHDVSLYLIRNGDRVERVAVIARSLRDRSGLLFTSANKPSWNRALRTLLAGLRFANQGATPPKPARLGSGPIVGVWNGIGMSFSEFKTEFAIFFDNGMAYFGPKFPIDGLYDINPLAEQLESPRYWGTYTFANGQGTLTMLYGQIPLHSSGSALVLTTNRTDHRYIRRSMPTDGLNGTYCLAPGRLARSSDPQYGPCMSFTAAGRFEENGAVKVLEHEVYLYDETPLSGAGRYEIRDHTLVLHYDSGQEVRIAFPGFLEAPSQSPLELVLGFNEDVLKRR